MREEKGRRIMTNKNLLSLLFRSDVTMLTHSRNRRRGGGTRKSGNKRKYYARQQHNVGRKKHVNHLRQKVNSESNFSFIPKNFAVAKKMCARENKRSSNLGGQTLLKKFIIK